MRRLAVAGTLAGAMIIAVPLALAAHIVDGFISTPMGAQAVTTPQLRVESPTTIFKTGERIPVKVAYRDFDWQKQRCGPAGPCLGESSQELSEGGLVRGHIHVYFQRMTGKFPEVGSNSFCVPEDVTLDGTGGGVVEGTCPAVSQPGLYRVSAEFQSQSHVAILKARAQDMPTTDNLTVRAMP
jgi:hypothetical protein